MKHGIAKDDHLVTVFDEAGRLYGEGEGEVKNDDCESYVLRHRVFAHFFSARSPRKQLGNREGFLQLVTLDHLLSAGHGSRSRCRRLHSTFQ